MRYEFQVPGYDQKFQCLPFGRYKIETSNYRDWWDDPEVTQFNSHGLFPKSEKEFESFYKDIEDQKQIVWMVVYNHKTHIGNFSLQHFDWINRSAEFAIVIGEKSYWKKGIGKECLKIALQHGFEKLNLHRIWTGTAATNVGMQRIAASCDFKEEGRFMDAVYLNGSYVDVVEYGILQGFYLGMKSKWKIPVAEDGFPKQELMQVLPEDLPEGYDLYEDKGIWGWKHEASRTYNFNTKWSKEDAARQARLHGAAKNKP